MRQYEKDKAALLSGGVRLGLILLSSVGIITVWCGKAAAEGCGVPPDCPRLGYTMSAAQCQGVAMIKCPTNQNFVYCDKKLTDTVREGDYLYSDMTTSPVLISGKKVIGVVYSIRNRLAISLEEKALVWAKKDSSCEKTNIPGTEEDGFTATNNIYNMCGSDAPAAEYCMTYATEGTKAGDWFIPSKRDIIITADYYRKINCQINVYNRMTWCYEKNPYPYGMFPLPTSKDQFESCDDNIDLLVEPLNCTKEGNDSKKPYNLRLLLNAKIKEAKGMQISKTDYWTSQILGYNSLVNVTEGLTGFPGVSQASKTANMLTRCMIQF